MSRDQVIEERGYDPEDVDAQIAAGNERADGYGNVNDSDPRKVNDSGQASAPDTAGDGQLLGLAMDQEERLIQ